MGVNPHYERALVDFCTCRFEYTCHVEHICHPELFLVARDKRHSTARLTALTVPASARNPLSGSQKLENFTKMSFRGAVEESSATALNIHNHDLDSFIRIRSLRNDIIECHSELGSESHYL